MFVFFFFFKQKTAYEISRRDWSSDVCSSDLISAINGYYYPYLIYHVSHERNVFPQLGIASDEKVVAHAMPKVGNGLRVMERELSHGKDFLIGPELTLADFYMLPMIHAFGFAPEAQELYPKFPAICAWRERMEALPALKRFRTARSDRARPAMG